MANVNVEGVKYEISAVDATGNAIVSAKRNFKDFGDASENAFNRAKNSWAMMTAGFASALYIFNQVKGYAAYFTNAYLEQEKAENRLSIAMKNMHDYSTEAHWALVGFASELQKTTAISDEASLGVMALLKTFGMSDDVLKKTTASVLDLSVGLEIDLQTAAKMMGKAFIGETGTLGRFGIKVDETKFGIERFNDIMAQVQQRFGGFAQGELDTYSGRWQNLKNQISDTAEVIGKFLLNVSSGGPIIDAQTIAINKQADWFNELFGIKLYYIKQISPQMVEKLREEARAWELFSINVEKFKPIADETIKAMERMAIELIKIGIERKFIGGSEFEKQKAMLAIEKKTLEKAGVDELQIASYIQAKSELIEANKQEAFRKIREKGAEDYAVALANNAEAEEDAMNAVIQSRIMTAFKREEIENESAMRIAESWGIYADAQQDALDEWGKSQADAMGNWEEIRQKTREADIASWEKYYDEMQEIQRGIVEYQIQRQKIGEQSLAFLTAEGEALIKNAAAYGVLKASLMQYNVAQELYLGMEGAVKNALVSAILGYESFGKAIMKATAAALASIAAKSAVEALYNLAYGWYCLATYQYAASAAAFKAAAFFAAAAVMAGSTAAIMQGGAGGVTPTERGGYEAERGTAAILPIKEEKAPIVVNLYVYGSIVDHDKFTRELIPSLTKAYEDNVH